MKKFVLFCLTTLLSISAWSYDFEENGIYYNILDDGVSAEVTWGGETNTSGTDSYTGDITIPSSASDGTTSYTVTGLGESAFRKCTLTTISLPSTITSFGDYTFYQATSLTKMDIPEGVTTLPKGFCGKCTKLASVTFPESLTRIEGDYAFDSCSGLTELNLPSGLTYIGYGTFMGCTGLTSVVLPSNLEYLGGAAFSCSGLESITIPKSVTEMGEYTFDTCDNLVEVTLEEGLTVIGDYAFSYCQALTSIVIPGSITHMGEGAFSMCLNLNDITLSEGMTSIGAYAFEQCGNIIDIVEEEWDHQEDSYWSITIPSTITEWGEDSFRECYTLHEVILTEGLTTLGGGYDFEIGYNDLSPIEKIYIPASVVNVGDCVFGNCTRLSEVTFGENSQLTYIPEGMFAGCSSLTSINLPSSLTSIGIEAFGGCDLSAIEFPAGLTYIGNYAFANNGRIAELSFPDGLEFIGAYAFEYNMFDDSSVSASVTIPESVTSIGAYAFFYCKYLTEVNILANIDEINSQTFYHCDNLATVSIPKTVENIGSSAFSSCSNITSFTSLNSDAPICSSSSVFSSGMQKNCTLYVPIGSEETYAKASVWEDFATIVGIEVDDDGKGGDKDETKFVEDGIYYQYVDKEAMTVEVTYESTSFRYYTGSVNIPATVTHNEQDYTVIGIGENAFRDSPELTAVSISEGITYMGDLAFYECSALTGISFPSSITAISSSAFYGCSSLTALTIPATITAIGSSAFQNCTQLATITFEDGEELLSFSNNAAFLSCPIVSVYLGRNLDYNSSATYYSPLASHSTLTDITFGENITSLGDRLLYQDGFVEFTIPSTITSFGKEVFNGCSSLKTLTISDGITTLGNDMFQNCTALTDVYLPEGLTDMGENAFRSCTSLAEIRIPSTVTSAVYAFYGCTGLTEVRIPSAVTSAESAFERCTGLKKVTLAEGLAGISNRMFRDCSSLTEIALPSSISSMDNYAFSGCTSLEKVTFLEGENTYYINMDAFDGCTSLRSILLPSNVNRVGSSAFSGCTSLTKVVFPNPTGSNSGSCFAKCSSLEEVILCAEEQSNQYIATSQFSGCTSLSRLYVLSSNAPIVANANAFENVPTETCLLYVPVGSKEKYANDTYWSVFNNIVELSAPLAVTYCVGNITEESAQINGLVAVGTTDITEVGFEYWADGDDTPTVIVVSDSFTATDELHATLADLAYGMTYTYHAYAKTASSTYYGDEVTFTLPIDGARVFTLEATTITDHSAVLNGRLVLPEDESATEMGFEYWLTEDDVQTIVAGTTGDGDFSADVTELAYGTTYNYRTYAKIESGTVYGDELTFTTELYAPVIITLEASDIAETTAVLNGTVTQGSEPINRKGFVYWSDDPNVVEVIIISDEDVEMNYTLSSLTPETTYTYHAFATTDSGTTYGDNVVFTTLEDTTTGINGARISLDDENVEGIYSTSGQKLNSTVKGVNIILYKDGTTKKVLVK